MSVRASATVVDRNLDYKELKDLQMKSQIHVFLSGNNNFIVIPTRLGNILMLCTPICIIRPSTSHKTESDRPIYL